VREEFLSGLTSEDYKGLGDEELLKVYMERLSKLKTPLSQAIAEERESR